MKRFNNILCIVESNAPSPEAIQKAVSLAKNHQADLSVVSVIEKPELLIPPALKKEEKQKHIANLINTAKSELDSFVTDNCEGVKVTVEVLTGIKFIAIIRDVLRHGRDLVVKTPSKEGWLERFFGSDDMHLLRKCPCPVLMLQPNMSRPFENILATVDVSDDGLEQEDDHRVQAQLNIQVLELSLSMAMGESSELHIGSVWHAYAESFLRSSAFSNAPEEKVDKYIHQVEAETKHKLDNLVTETIHKQGKEVVDFIRPQIHFVKGMASKQIPEIVLNEKVDLIVMGTVARTGIAGLLIGNTAETILEQVSCSVLAIKPEGFVTPVQLS